MAVYVRWMKRLWRQEVIPFLKLVMAPKEEQIKSKGERDMFLEIAEQYKGNYGMFHPFRADEAGTWEGVSEEKKRELIHEGEALLHYEYPFLPAIRYMDFCRNGNRTRYQGPFRMRRNVLTTLTLAECAERKGRFLEDIINGMMAICEESGWQAPAHNVYPARGYTGDQTPPGKPVTRTARCLPDERDPVMDLFSCETAASLSLCAWMLNDKINAVTPLVLARVHRELMRRSVEPFLTRSYWWMCDHGEAANNWTAWCTQNTLITVFSMEGISQETKQAVVRKAAVCLDRFISEYGEDGCCNEGAGYYHHAGLTLFGCLEVLNAVTDGAFSSLYHTPLIRNMASYIMNVHVDETYYINFADCAPKLERAGVREYLFAKRTGNEDMMRFAAGDHKKAPRQEYKDTWKNMWYQLLEIFTELEMGQVDLSVPVRKPDLYYGSTGLLLMRDSRFCLAVKAGDNDDSHNHNDVGSITLYERGLPMLIDVGVETYTSKTFSADRYDIWTMQSAYHNVMTFAGTVMEAPGPRYKAEVRWVKVPGQPVCSQSCAEEALCSEDMDWNVWDGGMEMEVSGAYPEGKAPSWVRRVRMKKEVEIRVTETLGQVPEGTFLTLMMRERPEWKEEDDPDGRKRRILRTGSHPDVIFEDPCCAQIEPIYLEDEKLRKNWDTDTLYRIKVYPEKLRLEWVIKNLEML